MADAIVVYDVNINTQNAESTIKMLGGQIAEIGTALTSAFQVGAIGSFATESVAAYERIADAQNEMTKAASDSNAILGATKSVVAGVISELEKETIKYIKSTAVKVIDNALRAAKMNLIAKEIAAQTTAIVVYNAEEAAVRKAAAAKQQAAMASNLMSAGLLMGIVAIVALMSNADNLSTGMKVLTAVLIGLVAFLSVLKVKSIITGSTMLMSFAPVLVPIMAIIAAIAAVVAIVSLFSSKSDLQKRAEADTKAIQDLNEELDETRGKLENFTAAQQAAEALAELNEEANRTDNLSEMKAQAEELNKALGDGAVTIDSATGAIMLYGQVVDGECESLKTLAELKKEDIAISELQSKLNDANAAKTNAQNMLSEAEAGKIQLTNAAKTEYNKVIEESTALIDENTDALEGHYQKQKELSEQRASQLEGEDGEGILIAQQQLNEQLLFDQMSFDEKIASLRVEDFENEQDYINAVAEVEQQRRDSLTEHQKAIEDATRKHADTLFGLNEEGLYSNTKSVEELNAIWQKNQTDMANYQTNLQALTGAGFTELAGQFDEGGVAMGGSLQNCMDALKGLSHEQWVKIADEWKNGSGKIPQNLGVALSKADVEAGIAMLGLEKTTKEGMIKATNLGEAEVGGLQDGVSESIDLAKTELGVKGKELEDAYKQTSMDLVDAFVDGFDEKTEELQGTSKQAVKDVIDAFEEGLEEQHSTMRSDAFSAGAMFMSGLQAGLDENKWGAFSKAREIANTITRIIRRAWRIKSPSKVAMAMGGYFSEGIAEGIDSEQRKAVSSAENLASGVVNVGESLLRASTITNNIAPQYSMVEAGVNIDYNMLAAAMANVNINMDSVTVGKLVEPSVSKVQANRVTNKF